MNRGLNTALALLLAGKAAGEDGMRPPWESRMERPAVEAEQHPEIRAAVGLLRFFQRVVSPVDGARCNLYPSCSEFSRQAIRRYGLLAGFALTAGRLMRDNASAPRNYRAILLDGRVVLYDPPEDHWPPFRAARPR